MFERLIFFKIEAWVLLVILLLSIPTASLFGWMVLYKAKGGKQGGAVAEFAMVFAEFPEPFFKLLKGVSIFQPQKLSFDAYFGLKIRRTDIEETGTLLISGFSAVHGVSTVYLYDMRSKTVLHEWVPPVESINKVTSYHDGVNVKLNYRTQHPLLLENGDLVFTSGEGPLVRINACSELAWTVNRHFHHSVERSGDGYLYVPHVIATPQDPGSVTTEGHLVGPIREDGFAKVSMDGEIVKEWSVKDILERHGYFALLYGVGPFEIDRFHLNDVEPIRESDEYVQKGDLVLSIRNLSTVLLYRPATDEIVWLQTGPWLNQHDVDYQGDGLFTVFGNDSLRGATAKNFLRGYSTIWQYDQKTGEAKPYLSLEHVGIKSESQGLHRILENGDVFIEEQNVGKLHRVAPDGLVWSYVNGRGDGIIGQLHWSRYLTAEEAVFPWLRKLSCN